MLRRSLRFAILHYCPRCNSILGEEEEGEEEEEEEGEEEDVLQIPFFFFFFFYIWQTQSLSAAVN